MGKKDDLAGDLLRGRKIKKKIVPTAEEVTEVVKKVTTPNNQPEKEQNVEAKSKKTKVKKEAPSSPVDTENTVTKTAQPEPKKEEKKLIRTTIDLPAYVHKAIKVKAAQEGISLKRYLVSLVKSDLDLE